MHAVRVFTIHTFIASVGRCTIERVDLDVGVARH